MEKLNRNNADIDKILNKKVAIVCPTKEKELDFRKWAKQYVNAIDEDYCFNVCHRKDFCIILEEYNIMWDYKQFLENENYEIYEWEVVEEQKTCTKKIKDAKPLTKEKKEILKSCLPQKTYTIKDVVENEGKVYKCITDCNNGVLYKYIDDVLYANYNRIEWKKSLVALRKLLKYEFVEYKIEYKPESKISAFEEALKEMETKVCRSMFSNRLITIHGSQFFDVSNRENTKLSLPEITGDWVVNE